MSNQQYYDPFSISDLPTFLQAPVRLALYLFKFIVPDARYTLESRLDAESLRQRLDENTSRQGKTNRRFARTMLSVENSQTDFHLLHIGDKRVSVSGKRNNMNAVVEGKIEADGSRSLVHVTVRFAYPLIAVIMLFLFFNVFDAIESLVDIGKGLWHYVQTGEANMILQMLNFGHLISILITAFILIVPRRSFRKQQEAALASLQEVLSANNVRTETPTPLQPSMPDSTLNTGTYEPAIKRRRR